jgi:cytochrome c oxidase subunit 2
MKIFVTVLLILTSLFILAGCGKSTSTTGTISPTTGVTTGTTSAANGRSIYMSSVDQYGNRITSSGGPGMGMMQGTFSCATCHGADGHGGRVTVMMQTYDVPDITWTDLTASGMMDHPPYTEATLKRAITEGIDPAGEALEYPMPKWQMSEQDLDELVGFLKTLK